MDDTSLNNLISRIKSNQENSFEAQNEIFEKNLRDVSYFYTNVLVAEKSISKYTNLTFDKLFKQIKSEEFVDAKKFYEMLYTIMVDECNKKLEETENEFKSNWVESSYDFINDVYEVSGAYSENPMLYSENTKSYVLSMMKELPPNERIVAYSYYFLDLSIDKIASIIGVNCSDIEKFLKSVRFNIETNIRYANNTQETVLFTKQTIRSYLYFDLNSNQSNFVKNNIYMQNTFTQQRDNYTNQTNNQTFNNTTVNETNEKQNKKQSATMFIILAIVVVLIAGIVVLSLVMIMNNKDINNTTKNEETIETNAVVPVTSIQATQSNIYLKVGESIELDFVITPSNASTKDLTNMIKYEQGKPLNGDWCYQIEHDDIISYDVNKKTIKALKTGTSQFKVTSLKFENNNELITCLIFVNVIDDISFNVSKTSVNLGIGDTETIDYTITPESYKSKIAWTSSDENIAVVSDGKIVAKKTGVATIKGTVLNTNIVKEIKVTITSNLDPNATVEGKFSSSINKSPKVGDTIDLTYTVTPSNDYAYIDIFASGSDIYTYDKATNKLTIKQATVLIITLKNILTDESLDSFFLNVTE